MGPSGGEAERKPNSRQRESPKDKIVGGRGKPKPNQKQKRKKKFFVCKYLKI